MIFAINYGKLSNINEFLMKLNSLTENFLNFFEYLEGPVPKVADISIIKKMNLNDLAA